MSSLNIGEILAYLHNYFVIDGAEIVGEFTISDGSITLPIMTNQYYRICGSIMNDGVHRYPSTDLVDETFEGSIFPLAVPPELLSIADEMSEWQEKNGNASPFQSESFGGYSYSRATSASGGMSTVFDSFASRLKRWKKV